MILLGRQKIYTDAKEVNSDNIIKVLRKAYNAHLANAADIQCLFEFEAGLQPLKREKKVRKDIDIRIHDNVAHQIVEFNKGYFWSSPKMLVQRGSDEAHGTDADRDSEGISAMNEMLKNALNMPREDLQLGDFVEKCGIGHRLIDVKTADEFKADELYWTDDGVYTGALANVYTLDSRYAFCVYHNGVGRKKVLGVTFVRSGGKLKFTCFTDKKRYEIEGWDVKNEQVNPLGAIPIVEFERASDRMGSFERNMDEIDGLNIMISDFTNDVSQRTQELWWGNNVDFPTDEKTGEEKKPQSGDWVLTYSGEGRTANIQPLSSSFNGDSTITAIREQRNRILQEANVPIRYENSGGGSTGVAMDTSTGWSDAEIAAMQKQQMVDKGKREELNLIIRAIRLVPTDILPADAPIRKIHSTDVEYKYPRRNEVDLSTQANCFATLVSHGVHPHHALQIFKGFYDTEQVYIDSKPYFEAYLKSIFNSGEDTEGRTMQDLSDQAKNSPLIDGMKTE